MISSAKRRRPHLTRLEQILMDYVWAHPGATVETCRVGVAPQRSLKESTVRTVLRTLEQKGYVSHEVEGRAHVYRAVETPLNVAVHAAQQLIDRFCAGSVEDFLVGLVDNEVVEPKELRRLAEKITQRRRPNQRGAKP